MCQEAAGPNDFGSVKMVLLTLRSKNPRKQTVVKSLIFQVADSCLFCSKTTWFWKTQLDVELY